MTTSLITVNMRKSTCGWSMTQSLCPWEKERKEEGAGFSNEVYTCTSSDGGTQRERERESTKYKVYSNSAIP